MNHPLTVAATRPLPVLVLLATIAVFLTAHYIVVPLGLIAYVVMVWMMAHDPAILTPKPQRPQLARINSTTFQTKLKAIDTSRRDIERSADSSPAALQKILLPIAEQADELYYQAHGLAEKGQIIEQYLQASQPQRLQNDIYDLDQRIAATSDQYTRDQLEETRAALIDRQQNAQALETYYSRITAQLQNIAANLDNVLAETVRLRASDAGAATRISQDVSEQMRNLNADMDAFQHVLEGALSGAI